eukprot:6177192-Pleurochrysis_carterae.AAC.3
MYRRVTRYDPSDQPVCVAPVLGRSWETRRGTWSQTPGYRYIVQFFKTLRIPNAAAHVRRLKGLWTLTVNADVSLTCDRSSRPLSTIGRLCSGEPERDSLPPVLATQTSAV